jgi:hypothetical protein
VNQREDEGVVENDFKAAPELAEPAPSPSSAL